MHTLASLAALQVLRAQPRRRRVVERHAAALYPAARLVGYAETVRRMPACYATYVLMIELYGVFAGEFFLRHSGIPARELLYLRRNRTDLGGSHILLDMIGQAFAARDAVRVHVLCRLIDCADVWRLNMLSGALIQACDDLTRYAHSHHGPTTLALKLLIMIAVLLRNGANVHAKARVSPFGSPSSILPDAAMLMLWTVRRIWPRTTLLDCASLMLETHYDAAYLRTGSGHLLLRCVPPRVATRMCARAHNAAWRRAIDCVHVPWFAILARGPRAPRFLLRDDHGYAPLLRAQPGAPRGRVVRAAARTPPAAVAAAAAGGAAAGEACP